MLLHRLLVLATRLIDRGLSLTPTVFQVQTSLPRESDQSSYRSQQPRHLSQVPSPALGALAGEQLLPCACDCVLDKEG